MHEECFNLSNSCITAVHKDFANNFGEISVKLNKSDCGHFLKKRTNSDRKGSYIWTRVRQRSDYHLYGQPLYFLSGLTILSEFLWKKEIWHMSKEHVNIWQKNSSWNPIPKWAKLDANILSFVWTWIISPLAELFICFASACYHNALSSEMVWKTCTYIAFLTKHAKECLDSVPFASPFGVHVAW